MENKKFLAHVKTAEIASVFSIPPIYTYNTHEDAVKKLMTFKEKFIVANPQKIRYNQDSELVLWVREYKVEESKTKGFYGNYIKLYINKYFNKGKDVFTIAFEDLKLPLKFHPQRGIDQTTNRKHSNWGHPVLRAVKKGQEFINEKEAESQLYKLYNEYPDVSYAYPNRIITMVYSAEYKEKTKSFIFDVVKKDNGKYHIVYKENDYKNIGHFKLFNYGFSLLK